MNQPFEPKFRSISLTIVDFLGAFLPGVIWMFVAWYFISLMNIIVPTFFKSLVYYNIFKDIQGSELLTNKSMDILAIFCFLIIGSILGYIMEAIVMAPASHIAPFFQLRLWKNSFKGNEPPKLISRFKNTYARYLFPFDILYAEEIGKFNKIRVSHELDDSKEKFKYGLFSLLKRRLKIKSPNMWEEIERLEANARMLGSLFMAGFANLLIATIKVFIGDNFINDFIWFLFSIFIACTLAYAFMKRHKKEVRILYLNYMVYINSEKEDREMLK